MFKKKNLGNIFGNRKIKVNIVDKEMILVLCKASSVDHDYSKS